MMPNAAALRGGGVRMCAKRALLALSIKVTASKLRVWLVPTRYVSSKTRTHATSLLATQGCRTTTSALSWWKAVCLVQATECLLLPFLLFLSSRRRLKEPSLVSSLLSDSRCSRSYLHSCQYSASLPPWLCLLLLPTQVPRYLLPLDRQVQPVMRCERELCWHSSLSLTLRRRVWGSPSLSPRPLAPLHRQYGGD